MEEQKGGTPMEQELPVQESEAVQEAPAVEEPEAVAEEVQETAAPEKKSSAGLVIALVAVLAAIVVLVVMLVTGKQKPEAVEEDPIIPAEEAAAEEAAQEETAEEETAEEETIESAEEGAADLNAYVPSVSYIQPEEFFTEEAIATVVATCGESTLDVQKLAYYYWEEFYTTINQMGSYASYFIDQSARLDGQQYAEDESWDQYLMNKAIEAYSVCVGAAEQAKAAGFELPETEAESIKNLRDKLELSAANYGCESADELVATIYGPYCDVESYTKFLEEYRLGATYLSHLLENTEITDEDLVKYYEENPDTFASLEKDDTLMVNVRHILIQPEAVELTEEDEGYEAAVQEAKDAAKAKAEEILADWEAGDKTQDSFAALATEHTQDPGSATTGGLYENVYPGQTVPAFNDWCFDEVRAAGDTGIVETDYGYHIMFFVGDAEESYWHSVVLEAYRNNCYMGFCEDAKAAFPTEFDLTKAAIFAANAA